MNVNRKNVTGHWSRICLQFLLFKYWKDNVMSWKYNGFRSHNHAHAYFIRGLANLRAHLAWISRTSPCRLCEVKNIVCQKSSKLISVINNWDTGSYEGLLWLELKCLGSDFFLWCKDLKRISLKLANYEERSKANWIRTGSLIAQLFHHLGTSISQNDQLYKLID